jgi:hypothetical protein
MKPTVASAGNVPLWLRFSSVGGHSQNQRGMQGCKGPSSRTGRRMLSIAVMNNAHEASAASIDANVEYLYCQKR